MEYTLIPSLTRNQTLSISFTAVILVLVVTVLFLMIKSLKDNRAYHSIDLPELETGVVEEEEKSAFAVEESFGNEEQETFFSVEDDDEPLFDFGKDESDIPDLLSDDDDKPAGKKKSLFGGKKTASRDNKVKKTRKQKQKDKEKLAQDRVLVEEIIKSTTPKKKFDAVNPLDETALDASQNVFQSFDPTTLDEDFAIDDEYKVPADELPKDFNDLMLEEFESDEEEELTLSPSSVTEEIEDYVDPKDFLANRGISIQDALALEEEDDDFTPEVKKGDSAFGSSGLHDFDLRETQNDELTLAPPKMNIKIPSEEVTLQPTNYVGKRRREAPLDNEDLT